MTHPRRLIYGFPARPGFEDRLRAAGVGIEIEFRPFDQREDVDRLEDPQVEALFSDYVPAELSKTPRLRWVQYSGAGVDDLAEEKPWDRGVAFSTASGVNALPVAEYVLGTMFRISQRVALRIENQRRRAWTLMDEPLRGRPLRGSTLAILGYGSIGREVGRLGAAVGTRVVAVKRDPTSREDPGFRLPGTGDPDGRVPEAFHSLNDVGTAVSQADYVVACLPLTEETRGIIGQDVLRAMPRSAWLINVGRGALIDEEALQLALNEGAIAGAAIDVAAREPLAVGDPLWDVQNLIITPHVAGANPDLWSPLEALFLENLGRFTRNEPLLNVVRPDRGY